jgi:alkylation response protein AidB-like acyl-CoA dehydrogenase
MHAKRRHQFGNPPAQFHLVQLTLADHGVDRLYCAVRALRIYEGTTEIQQLTIAGELLK